MNTNQTFTILFWLFKAKMRNGKAPIYCRITVNGKRAQFSLKRSIDPNKWISSSGVAKGNSEEARILNTYLNKVRNELLKHFNLLEAKEEFITADTIKNSYLGIKEEERSLIETFKYHNNQMKELIGIDVVKATHTKFETVLSKLELYLKKHHKRSDLFLKELDHKFIVDFEYFLKVDQGIGHNTTMKYIRNLKKVINMAVANDWLAKNPFASFKCSNKKVHREILTEEELTVLAKKEFSIERLEEVRDIFLFCCYTGYAFVDVEKLTSNDLVRGINGGLWVYTNRKKTGTASNVPLLPPALEILEKYKEHPYCESKGKLLPVKSNQKMNAYLKEVADLCGITKKLTMHIARHTFATTVTLSNGVPIETVSKLLGHTKLATTQIYAQVMEHKVSEDMEQLGSRLFSSNKGVNSKSQTKSG
jgi:site-specific recombinase XerD